MNIDNSKKSTKSSTEHCSSKKISDIIRDEYNLFLSCLKSVRELSELVCATANIQLRKFRFNASLIAVPQVDFFSLQSIV